MSTSAIGAVPSPAATSWTIALAGCRARRLDGCGERGAGRRRDAERAVRAAGQPRGVRAAVAVDVDDLVRARPGGDAVAGGGAPLGGGGRGAVGGRRRVGGGRARGALVDGAGVSTAGASSVGRLTSHTTSAITSTATTVTTIHGQVRRVGAELGVGRGERASGRGHVLRQPLPPGRGIRNRGGPTAPVSATQDLGERAGERVPVGSVRRRDAPDVARQAARRGQR